MVYRYGRGVSPLLPPCAPHASFGPEFERLAGLAVASGEPIVRPLLWKFPDDRTTEPIGDQFMLGDRWLVAPVVEARARARDVYLPAGRWRDELGAEHDGPRWLRDEPAPLDRLPRYERLADHERAP